MTDPRRPSDDVLDQVIRDVAVDAEEFRRTMRQKLPPDERGRMEWTFVAAVAFFLERHGAPLWMRDAWFDAITKHATRQTEYFAEDLLPARRDLNAPTPYWDEIVEDHTLDVRGPRQCVFVYYVERKAQELASLSKALEAAVAQDWYTRDSDPTKLRATFRKLRRRPMILTRPADRDEYHAVDLSGVLREKT